MNTFPVIRNLLCTALCGVVLLGGDARSQEGLPGASENQALKFLLSRECINLDRDRMYLAITDRFADELASGPAPDLLRIIEGVIKRTDFDALSEEKSVEIIGLVHGAFRKGAPLEYLDEIFDVAYASPVTDEQLAAAANALRDFDRSDVPRDIYEEFVYHSIENGWDPAVTPILARGLIYGVDRGLSPDKVALIIMLDMKNGEIRDKKPEQLVLDAVKLVREKEPRKWKPMSADDREAAAKQQRAADLARKQQEIDGRLQERERAFLQAQRELKELRESTIFPLPDRETEKRDLERLIRRLEEDITRYQYKRGRITTQLETTRQAVERQLARKDRDRQKRRERDLAATHQRLTARGREGRLNRDHLVATVNQYIGTPYRFGGDSERGIDCSAFTRRVYRGQGVELPRNSREQARVSSAVSYQGMQTGDLVFFDTSINGAISHVGVYLGNGIFAHASSSQGVKRSSIRERYYVKRFVKGGRIFND